MDYEEADKSILNRIIHDTIRRRILEWEDAGREKPLTEAVGMSDEEIDTYITTGKLPKGYRPPGWGE